MNDPKLIRFSEAYEDVDLTSLKECLSRQETFPIGTHSIPLNNIALAKLLIIKPDADLDVSINGATALTMLAGKRTKIWGNISSLSITVATAAQEVLILLAGE